MMEATAERREWVRRVLGVDVGMGARSRAQANPLAVQQVLAEFDAAQEEIESQIARLQAKLRGSSDASLQRIAEFGLNGVTGNSRVLTQAALFELRHALPRLDPDIVSKATKALRRMASHLANDNRIRACDHNCFGVKVSIAETLGGAARRLYAVLSDNAA
jgi:hypothetical protein